MSTLLSTDISGHGVVTFTNSPVESVVYALTTLPERASLESIDTPYRLMRGGWLSFGNQFDPGDGVTRELWSTLRFLDFVSGFIFPPGRANESAGVGNYFDRIRFDLGETGAGHIWVYTF